MWKTLHLVMWILLVLQHTYTATGKRRPPFNFRGFLKNMKNNFTPVPERSSGSKGTTGSKSSKSSDSTTTDDIVHVYKTAFENLKTTKWDCVPGLCDGSDGSKMKILSGSVSFDPDDLIMNVDEDEITSAKPGYIYAPIKFTFPDDTTMSAEFKYKGEMAGIKIPYTKRGDAVFKVGPITVTVAAMLPDTRAELMEAASSEECQYKMSPEGVSFETGDDFDVDSLDYSPKSVIEYSKPIMYKTFFQLKSSIIMNVIEHLGSHIVEQVKNVVFSCLDEKAEQKWQSPSAGDECPPVDCDI